MNNRKGYIIADQYAMHFVTFTIVGWVDVFTRKECKKIFIDSLKYCIENKGLVLYAYVIMPSHVHLIISAEENSQGLSAIIRDMKKHASKEILKWTLNSKKESRKEWLEVVSNPYYLYSSTRNYADLDDILIDVKIINYGIQTGYVLT